MSHRFVPLAVLLTVAVPASAVSLSSAAYYTAPVGDKIIDNFDDPAPGVTLSGSYSIQPGSTGDAATPAGDLTNYFATPSTGDGSSGTATIDFSAAETGDTFHQISFYWGSIDTYNTLTLLGTGLSQSVFTGSDITATADGDRSAGSTNRRVTFTLAAGERVTGLELTSSQRAFEIDNVTATAPEPATWALLVAGFGLVGVSLRGRSRTIAA